MTIETTAIITGVAIVLIGGAIVAVCKHVSNENKHPNRSDIVFRDVCAAKEDCVETEIKNLKETIDKLDKTVVNGFTEIRHLIMGKD